jgi:hypothetical protein
MRALLILIGMAVLLVVFWGRQTRIESHALREERTKTGTPHSASSLKEQEMAGKLKNGERLARVSCQACHLFPEPALLDRRSWSDFVLPNMMLHLGLTPLEELPLPEREMFRSAGIIPPVPLISRSDWEQIVHYYLATAPSRIPPQRRKEEMKIGLPGFVVEPPRFKHTPALTTLLDIDPDAGQIYFADATTQALHILDSNGLLLQNIPVGNITVFLNRSERGLYLTCIGHFFPQEEKRGQVILLERTEQGYRRKVLLSDLHRPVHLELADLTGNGELDFVLSQFGYLTGRLSWFENLGNDEYREHLLFPKAGAIRTIVQDFNGDGHLDIAALIGQETEALIIFYGSESGAFTGREVFRKPPSYGHTYFEVADFNGDGLPDFLVTNGDNGDYHSPPKNYHGIRIYLNQGHDHFEEAFFHPMHGAFKAVARDFDGDGNLDIAAISFFPDYEKAPREGFVFLKNHGELTFSAYTFPESMAGRWLTLDAADLDGDGDIDIVLGSLIGMNTDEVPPFLLENWKKESPSVLILRNTSRD